MRRRFTDGDQTGTTRIRNDPDSSKKALVGSILTGIGIICILFTPALVGLGVPPVRDFVISVSPSSASVVQGGSMYATVSLVPVGGFAEIVSLSASGLPTGAVASFTPASGIPAFASNLTITTSTTTPTGTYTVNITGTGGGMTHTRAFQLNVTAPPDFEIEARDPDTGAIVKGGSVRQGESINVTIWIKAMGGFAGTVTLGLSGLPSGAIGTFALSSGTPDFNSTLTISLEEKTKAGTYNIAITASGDTLTHSYAYELEVTERKGFPFALTVGIIIPILVLAFIAVRYLR